MHDDDHGVEDDADSERERETSGAVHSEASLTLEIFEDTRITNTRHRQVVLYY